MSGRTAPNPWPMLILFVGLCFAAALIGGLVTVPNIPTWYAGLAKPSFQPPNGVFGPAWTVLYLTMAVAAWLAWKAGRPGQRGLATGLFLGQLALNALWSPLFFGLHLLLPALIDIAVLWLAIVATIIAFWRIGIWPGLLMLPYLAWVTFAGALNLAIWRLNP